MIIEETERTLNIDGEIIKITIKYKYSEVILAEDRRDKKDIVQNIGKDRPTKFNTMEYRHKR